MQSNMIRDFEIMERDQQGYATTNGLFAIINTLGTNPGPQEPRPLFRRHRHSNSGAPPLPRCHRRRQPRQREHLHDGRRRAARRERPGEDSRSGEPGGGVRRDDGVFGGRRGRSVHEGARGQRGVAAPGSARRPRRRSRRTPAACCSTTPTTCVRVSSASKPISATTTWSATRRSNDKFDGRFRTIEVKVKRPGVTVAARKGYFAVRDPGGVPVNTWEAPALGALEQKPVPNAFPVRAGALLFPERGRPGLVPVVVDLKTAPLTFLAHRRRQDLLVGLHGARALPRRSESGRAQGQPALRGARPDRADRTRQTGRSDLLPRVGAPGRRLHDGNGRLRRAVRQVERAVLDRRGAEVGAGQAAHEQPHARQARARRCRRRTAAPTTRSSSRT